MPNGPLMRLQLAPSRALRKLGLPVLAAGLLALAAALPSGAAASTTPDVELPPTPIPTLSGISTVSPQQLQELLGQAQLGGSTLPVADLEVPELTKLLVELPGFDQLSSVPGLGGTAGVEAALREALDKLLAHEITLMELLAPQQLGGELVKALEGTTHLHVAELIETLLKSAPAHVLEEGLSTTSLSALLAQLLAGAQNPTALTDRLVEALNPQQLQTLLGSLPSGEPLQNHDVAELAGALSKTPEALAQTLGQTASSLPATAAAVTKALADGNELALVKGTEGLAVALLTKGTESVEGGGAGTPVGSRSASEGAPGAPGGAGGAAGTTTVVVSTPASATPTAAAAAAAGKLKILSHSVHGNRATLVVQVPSAGRLRPSGAGFAKVAREAAKAERVTVQTTLTKSRAASLRKHRRKTTIKLTGTFVPVSGAHSAASTSVTVR